MGVAPPCTQVLLIECKRKLLPWPHLPSRLRSLPHQRGNTPYGSVDPSWPPSLPSNRLDHQARIRRMRSIHCPQEMLLKNWLMSAFNLLYMLSDISFYRHVNFNIPKNKQVVK